MTSSSGRHGQTLIKISLLIFLLGAVSVFVLDRLTLFTIKEIDTVAKNSPCVNESQLKNSSGLLGQNFFFVNLENIAKNLKSKFICLKNINLFYVFPNKIRIEASGRQPVAILNLLNLEATAASFLENLATPSAESSSDAYLIDNEGIIFSKSIGTLTVPHIFIDDMENHNIGNSLKILEKSKTFGLDVKTATILDNFFIIFSYPKVIFRLDDKVEAQIASLQLILAEAKIDLKELEFIDLRFDKPIIRIAPKK